MPTLRTKTINVFRPGGNTRAPRPDHRAPANARGYDAAWASVRAWYLDRRPLCELCEKEGRLTPAEMVHHRRPLNAGGARLDPDNLEALCWRCHGRRHAQLKSAPGAGGTDSDAPGRG